MRQLVFLGTGSGMPIASSTSCILVEDSKNNLLLDAAGGHEIIGKFHKAKKHPSEIKNIFLSHYDSDHILGIIPIVRALTKHTHTTRNIFCSKDVKKALESMFMYTASMHYKKVKPSLNFILIEDEMIYKDNGWTFTFFDTRSTKTPEFGCAITFPDKTKLTYVGDEPLREHNLHIIKNSDVLIHEAFCLEKDISLYEPHPKNHSTVKEAAQYAEKSGAKKLVLFHMEDETLETRKKEYLKEAKKYFNGEIFVPLDHDIYAF